MGAVYLWRFLVAMLRFMYCHCIFRSENECVRVHVQTRTDRAVRAAHGACMSGLSTRPECVELGKAGSGTGTGKGSTSSWSCHQDRHHRHRAVASRQQRNSWKRLCTECFTLSVYECQYNWVSARNTVGAIEKRGASAYQIHFINWLSTYILRTRGRFWRMGWSIGRDSGARPHRF